MGLEVLDQVPDLDAIVVPVGGGGLIAGMENPQREYTSWNLEEIQSFLLSSYFPPAESAKKAPPPIFTLLQESSTACV
jgi:hypothetical protein